ncbi:MAG: DNA mismatch repair protein MutS [Candidatus Algichlamydia australiensis]|nr:DNA mismatch repair protein MutS [Chlamydiales bacterium]
MATVGKTSPMMLQWENCKTKAKGALVLFRLGDFYEAFYDDAKILSEDLGLTLTKRQEIPMAGIPAQTLEGYLKKLIAKGHLVAIAEQVEDAKATKGLVKREVVRVVSPATMTGEAILQECAHTYFACVTQVGNHFGLALLDYSTGEMSVMELNSLEDLLALLSRKSPKEILVPEKLIEKLSSLQNVRVETKENYHFDERHAQETLLNHFSTQTLDGFGMKGMSTAIAAAGALLTHLSEERYLSLNHVRAIRRDSLSRYMQLDRNAIHHLDLRSLFKTIDFTKTAMGSRLLYEWLTHPLLSAQEIRGRQETVQELLPYFFSLQQELSYVRDLERLMTRIAAGIAGPRDLVALANSLQAIPKLQTELKKLQSIEWDFADVSPIFKQISSTLVAEPPLKLSDGHIIKQGFCKELDEIKALRSGNQEWLTKYQTNLRETFGIKTLKVGYNRAFGYFIEVSRGQAEKMPESFHKRQTLTNCERFISPELKSYEEKILAADERISALELRYFSELKSAIANYSELVQTAAQKVAELDCLCSFAQNAKEKRYVRPYVDEEKQIIIKNGRHPVVESVLRDGEFIPNHTRLDQKEHQLILLTGPNMAGKSTYIRQVALLTILAQTGSFVPAEKAQIGIVDRLFTRIGASDDLMRGQSTFMVEMAETATILHNATDRSLVILDEIGRGTSTYDGVSIAWSVAEHLLKKIGAKTLFATHYFELTELPGAKNFNVAVEEGPDGIIFTHKIVPGSGDRSYGIHVAKLAGLPHELLRRAEKMLIELEKGKKPKSPKVEQPSLFDKRESAVELELKKLDPNSLTPLQALELLSKWKSTI